MKEQKGITLVALVITIIVMLILVAVSVTVALKGGLFDSARTATLETRQAQLNEAIALAKAELLADYYKEPTAATKPTGPEVMEKINAYLEKDKVTEVEEDTTTAGKYIITVPAVYEMTTNPTIDLSAEYGA